MSTDRDAATIKLQLPSQLGWERAAMDLAGSVARKMGFPNERIEDIRTAVSEATINAIEHGNRLDTTQKVLLVLMPEGERLEISVRDGGAKPFTPAAMAGTAGRAAPSLRDRLAGLTDPRGWGMFLIQQLVDEVEFVSTSGGNQVRMVLYLRPLLPARKGREARGARLERERATQAGELSEPRGTHDAQ